MKVQAQIDYEKCGHCQRCVQVCKDHLFIDVNGRVVVMNDGCKGCGECVWQCTHQAISLVPCEGYCEGDCCVMDSGSQLYNWPVHLMKVNQQDPRLLHADLLLAANCTAFAYGRFHEDFIADKAVLIACPAEMNKEQMIERLTALIMHSSLNSIQLVRMHCSCCAALKSIIEEALQRAHSSLPVHETLITRDGYRYE